MMSTDVDDQAAQLAPDPQGDELGDLRARVAELEQLVEQLRPFIRYLPILGAWLSTNKAVRKALDRGV